jgi:hypothetical protein
MAGDFMVTATPGNGPSEELTVPTILPVCVVCAIPSPARQRMAATKRSFLNIKPPLKDKKNKSQRKNSKKHARLLTKIKSIMKRKFNFLDNLFNILIFLQKIESIKTRPWFQAGKSAGHLEQDHAISDAPATNCSWLLKLPLFMRLT